MAELFPRGKGHPSQSPLYWVSQKDRYLRQLLISDIQAETGRKLLVYFTSSVDPSAMIDFFDVKYLDELLTAAGTPDVDLFLETPGGITDATEQIVSLLLHRCPTFRAIVPLHAKSNGTLLALASAEIVMGDASELGPIDPQYSGVPCDFIVKAQASMDPILVLTAEGALKQTETLAETVLKKGMLAAKTEAEIKEVVKKLSSRDHYHSHGSVIDHGEAKDLGLNVKHHSPTDDLWRMIWLLRCMYDHDARVGGFSKVYESADHVSHAIKASPVTP